MSTKNVLADAVPHYSDHADEIIVTDVSVEVPVRKAWVHAIEESQALPQNTATVKGYDFNQGIDYHKILNCMSTTGFQATNLRQGIELINAMIDSKFNPLPEVVQSEGGREFLSEGRRKSNCTIMLGCTSNMVSSGNREIIKYLLQQNMVDCVVMTAGGVEEDFIKCLHPFYMGDFNLKGADLNDNRLNRTGNLIAPNTAYRKLHQWLNPILEVMVLEQENGTEWTPSKFIRRLGKEIDNPESICYWAYKNDIPMFSPAVTDGAIGDVLYFHRHTHPRNSLKLDIVEDVQLINDMAIFSVNTGALILGGGVVKHHILNANCSRDGLDFAVYVNTGAEFDGSDSGASPEEAISWGKIKIGSKPVKIFADATIILPFLVGETFAKREQEFKSFNQKQSNLTVR